METVRVAPGSDQQGCSCVGAHAEGFCRCGHRSLDKLLKLGLDIPDLLAQLTIAVSKRPKCVLGGRRGIVQTRGTEAPALLSKCTDAKSIKCLSQVGRSCDDERFHLVDGLSTCLDGRVLGAL